MWKVLIDFERRSAMALPDLTPLQYAILSAIGVQNKPGHEVRTKLKELGIRKSGPGFYQAMARLEDAGFVSGWYENVDVRGQVIKQRRYRVLGKGFRAFHRTRDFYSTRAIDELDGVMA
jgi:DNA-binding PadR family transcriptional regulator